jgi:anti-sigma B factor antagonist
MLDEESKGPAGIIGSVAVDGHRATVELRGEIDIASAAELRECVANCVEGGCSHLTLDTSGVSFLDSTGLRILVETARRLGAGNLILTDPPRIVRRLIEITGLEEMLPMEPPADPDGGNPSYQGNGRPKA